MKRVTIWDVLLGAPNRSSGAAEAERLHDKGQLDSVLFGSVLNKDSQHYYHFIEDTRYQFSVDEILTLYTVSIDEEVEGIEEEMSAYLDSLSDDEFMSAIKASFNEVLLIASNYFVTSREVSNDRKELFLKLVTSDPLSQVISGRVRNREVSEVERYDWTSRNLIPAMILDRLHLIVDVILLFVQEKVMCQECIYKLVSSNPSDSMRETLLDVLENVFGYRDMCNDASIVIGMTLYMSHFLSYSRLDQVIRRYVGCGIACEVITESVLLFSRSRGGEMMKSMLRAITSECGVPVSDYDMTLFNYPRLLPRFGPGRNRNDEV